MITIPAAFATDLTVGTVPVQVLEENLRAAPRDNPARQQQIVTLFRRVGCSGERLEERAIRHSKFSNVMCTLPGKEGVIVVGAHFDHVAAGDGIVDNWSGASLLPALVASLSSQPRSHTFWFVAFGREEEGLVGSREFADRLSKQDRARIVAMVNIDSVGLANPAIWLSRADKQLAGYSIAVAKALHVQLDAVNVEKVGNSDSASFIALHIPTIDFHSLRQETFPILHTARDKFDVVNMDAYAQTFSLIANYLAYIDQQGR